MIRKYTSFFLLLLSVAVLASSAKTVTHDSKVDFERGTLHNVTILHDGKITPSPTLTKLIDTGEPFIWSLAEDSNGALYIGAGIEGALFRVTAKGDTSLFFDAPELNIFAIAVDARNNVYAATSPDGKVYKIDSSGKSSVFFDPEAHYIWDLKIDARGNLIVATGEKAFIYKVSPDGKSTVLFQGEENHVRTLLLADGVIYAGTSGKGFVYRIFPGEPYVVFDTQMKEVFALAPAQDGFIYAAVSGEAAMPMLPGMPSQTQKKQQQGGDSSDSGEQSPLGPQTVSPEGFALASRGAPTSLFRISPEGYGKDLWVGVDDKIQSLLSDDRDGVLVGSGKNGKLLAMNSRGELSVLLKNDESHITALLRTHDGRVVLGMSNLGRCYVMNERTAKQASFESESIDAGLPAFWGTLTWEGENVSSLKFYTRSGNTEQPSKSWSSWTAVEKEGEFYRIKSPTARFIQWKCEFSSPKAVVDKATLSYIQKNLAPGISSIIIHKPGDYYEVKNGSDAKTKGIAFPAPLPSKQEKKGWRSIDWLFDDPNFDALSFDLYYRLVGARNWRLMVKDLNTNIYSWDSAQMMDGKYEIKVVASDAPANPENLTLSGEKVSRVFIIDNSGPRITQIKPGNNNGKKVLTFRIADEWNPLKSVEYSIDARAWEKIYPVDGILDSRIEDFMLEVGDGRDVAIKASDAIGNVRVAHTNLN